MRVLHLAPLWFPVSANAPGGIETLLAHLLPQLAALGCENTLLGCAGSEVSGRLVPALEGNLYSLMKAGKAAEQIYYEQHQISWVLTHAPGYDIVHSHLGPGAYVLSSVKELTGKVLHTHHWPVYADLEWFVGQHPEFWFSTVSEFQAAKLRQAGAQRCVVVPNGLEVERFSFSSDAGDKLVFLGRMERAKGPDLAIRTAAESGQLLALAGPIVEREFFEAEIKPFLNGRVSYRGVLNHKQKNELFAEASCVLMPSRAAEPFGMVSVEAMACGTPVVALAQGALPEIVEPGLTGYLAQHPEELPALAKAAGALNRADIRKRVTERFHIARTAQAYLRLYEEMLKSA